MFHVEQKKDLINTNNYKNHKEHQQMFHVEQKKEKTKYEKHF